MPSFKGTSMTSTTKVITNTGGKIRYRSGSFANSLNPPDVDTFTTNRSNVSYQSTITKVNEDRVLPWRELIKQGRDATTNVSVVVKERSWSPGTIGILTKGPGIDRYTGQYWRNGIIEFPTVHGVDIDTASAISECETQFLLAANKRLTTFKGATFVGELRETIRMIRNPAKNLFAALYRHHGVVKRRLRGVKGGVYRSGTFVSTRPSAASTASRIIADSWLLFRFGVKPLLNDIDDGTRALSDYLYRKFPPRTHVSVGARRVSKTTVLDGSESSFTPFAYKLERLEECNVHVVYRGGVSLLLDDSIGRSTTRHFGFNWSEVALAGWEIIPYSFLADYFVNIGETLEAAMFPRSQLLWSNRTIRKFQSTKRYVARQSCRSTNALPIIQIHRGEGAHCTLTTQSIVRERVTPSTPQLAFRVPGTLDLKWLNIAALLRLRLS